MTYNTYNFIGMPFNESYTNSVYWSNSELIITMLILIMLCQLVQTSFIILAYFKTR